MPLGTAIVIDPAYCYIADREQVTLAASEHTGDNFEKNVVTIRDVVRGDVITLTGVAFKKRPAINFAKEGGLNEWTFDAIKTVTILGVGTPEIL